MTRRTPTHSLHARSAGFETAIAVTGAILADPPANQRAALRTESVHAVESAAARNIPVTGKAVTRTHRVVHHASARGVDKSAWARADALEAGVPITTGVRNQAGGSRREALRLR